MTFNLYKDDVNEWRWRLRSANGRTLADSGEGYVNHKDCLKAVQIIARGASTAAVKDPLAGLKSLVGAFRSTGKGLS